MIKKIYLVSLVFLIGCVRTYHFNSIDQQLENRAIKKALLKLDIPEKFVKNKKVIVKVVGFRSYELSEMLAELLKEKLYDLNAIVVKEEPVDFVITLSAETLGVVGVNNKFLFFYDKNERKSQVIFSLTVYEPRANKIVYKTRSVGEDFWSEEYMLQISTPKYDGLVDYVDYSFELEFDEWKKYFEKESIGCTTVVNVKYDYIEEEIFVDKFDKTAKRDISEYVKFLKIKYQKVKIKVYDKKMNLIYEYEL